MVYPNCFVPSRLIAPCHWFGTAVMIPEVGWVAEAVCVPAACPTLSSVRKVEKSTVRRMMIGMTAKPTQFNACRIFDGFVGVAVAAGVVVGVAISYLLPAIARAESPRATVVAVSGIPS